MTKHSGKKGSILPDKGALVDKVRLTVRVTPRAVEMLEVLQSRLIQDQLKFNAQPLTQGDALEMLIREAHGNLPK